MGNNIITLENWNKYLAEKEGKQKAAENEFKKLQNPLGYALEGTAKNKTMAETLFSMENGGNLFDKKYTNPLSVDYVPQAARLEAQNAEYQKNKKPVLYSLGDLSDEETASFKQEASLYVSKLLMDEAVKDQYLKKLGASGDNGKGVFASYEKNYEQLVNQKFRELLNEKYDMSHIEKNAVNENDKSRGLNKDAWEGLDIADSMELKKYLYPTEEKEYAKIFVNNGRAAADKYLFDKYGELSGRKSAETQRQLKDFSEKYPVLGSVASLGTNLMSALEGVGNTVRTLHTGRAKRNYFADMTTAFRQGVSEKVDWNIGEWDAFDFLYNTGMSALDSLAVSPLGAGGALVLGLSAAGQTTNDILNRGGTNDQAFWGGLAAGAFESIFEKFSIGNINALKEVNPKSFKDAVLNIAKSMGVNASEEGATELANILWDSFVNGDISNVKALWEQYKAEGMTDQQARWQIALDLGLQIAEAAASGALMGFGFGTVGNASGYARNKAIDRFNSQMSNIFDTDGREYSIELDTEGKPFVQVNEDIFAENDGKSVAAVIADTIKTKFNNLISVNGQNIQINKTTNDEWRYSKKAQQLYGENPTAFNDKLKTIANADEVLKTAKGWIGEEAGHNRADDIVEFGRGFINYKVGNNGYSADVVVGIRKNGAAVLYDLVNIYEKQITAAPVATTKASDNSLRTPSATVTNQNIPQPAPVVNPDSQVQGTSMFSEPDLTTQKPQTFEEIAMANITGEKLRNENQKTVESIARLLNQKVEWYESADVTDRGYYENGVVHINVNANQPYTVVFTHEFLHHLQNTKAYAKFTEFVMGTNSYKIWIAQNGGYDAFSQIIKTTYEAREGKPMSETRLRYEIMARFVSEGFFTKADFKQGEKAYNLFEEIAQNHKWYHRVMDWIAEMINRLKRRSVQADFIKMQRLLKAAYSKVQSRAATVDTGREYAINQNFYSEFDSWDGKDTNKVFTIGTTSEALKSVNIKNQEIKMRSGMILQKLSKHPEMSRQIFRDIPELLENPIIIQFSDAIDPNTGKPKYDSRITVMGELYADMVIDGKTVKKPVLVSLELLPTNQKKTKILDVSFVTSAYGRPKLQSYLNENSILYIDPNKKRTQNWLSLNRLQLPLGENQRGPIRRITYIGEKVKIENSTKKTDIQLALEKAGVIDSYGNSIFKNSHNDTSKSKENFENRENSFDVDNVGERVPAKLYAKELLRDTGSSYEAELLTKDIEKIYAAADKSDAKLVDSLAQDTAAKLLNDIESRDFSKEGEKAGENALYNLTNDIINHINEETHGTLNRLRAENKRLKHTINDFEAAQQRKTDRSVIRKSINNLDKKFRANSNNKHVYEDLKGTVKAFLDIFLENDPRAFEKREISRVRAMYERLMGENPEITRDPDTEEKLKYLEQTMEGKTISKLTDSELQMVREIAEHFTHLVTSANEIFVEGNKEDFRALANEEVERLEEMPQKHYLNLGDGKLRQSVDEIKEFFIEGNLKPAYFFKKIGGVYKKLFDDISAGLDTTVKNINKATDFLQDTLKKYNYWSWVDKKQKIELGHANGQRITLTMGEAMSIYATYKREMSNAATQAPKHLSVGGIVLKRRQIVEQIEKSAKEKNSTFDKLIQHHLITAWASSPYKITEADIKEIEKQLGKEKLAFVDELVNYMSTVGSALGNEASGKLYGYNKFGEEYYFPFETSKKFLAREYDNRQAKKTLLGKSFTKNTVEEATSPLVISDFAEVFCKHMTEMCEYNGLGVPLNNLKRVCGFVDKGDEKRAGFSLMNELERVHGAATINYLNKFIEDVDGGIAGQKAGESVAGSLISLFQKNAVAANLSVIIQQPSSIARVLPYLEYKYLKADKGTFTSENWEECKEYCPIAIQKEMGRFDIGNPKATLDFMMGRQYDGIKDKAKGFIKDENYRDNLLGKAASKADQLTWCLIWNGCKNKIAATTDLKTNSVELKQEAAKLFKEVIEHTQVYDSVLSRSQNMRSKSMWTRMVTAFKGEPTTNLNMLHKAFWDFKNKNYKAATKGVIGVVSAALLNAILKSLVTAMRDDDEDKTYGEKYVTEVGGNFKSDINPAGWIPLISDVVSVFEGYQVKRADMEIVQDLYYSLKSLSSSEKTTWDKILAVANPIGAMCGVPVENVARDIGAVVNTVSHGVNDDLTHTNGFKYALKEGFDGEKTYAEYYEILRDKQKKGDTQGYNELKEYLMGRGKTEKEIESGVKAAYSKSKPVAKQSEDYFTLLAKNALFGKLPEEKQADVKTAVKRYLTESAMNAATGKEMSKTNQKAAEAQKNGSSAVNYFLAKASFEDTDNSGGISNEEKISAINKMNISAFEKQALIMLYTKK